MRSTNRDAMNFDRKCETFVKIRQNRTEKIMRKSPKLSKSNWKWSSLKLKNVEEIVQEKVLLKFRLETDRFDTKALCKIFRRNRPTEHHWRRNQIRIRDFWRRSSMKWCCSKWERSRWENNSFDGNRKWTGEEVMALEDGTENHSPNTKWRVNKTFRVCKDC